MSAKRFEVEGEELTIAEISAKYKINPATIRARVTKGLRGNDIISPPLSSKKNKNSKKSISVEQALAMFNAHE